MRRCGLAAMALAAALALVGPASGGLAAGRGGDPDGRYEGEIPADNAIDHAEISFRISDDGRRLTKWRTAMAVICAFYPPEVQLHPVVMPTIKIKRNGKFRKLFSRTIDGEESSIEVSGKLVGNRVKNGSIDYDVGLCVREADWRAKRVG